MTKTYTYWVEKLYTFQGNASMPFWHDPCETLSPIKVSWHDIFFHLTKYSHSCPFKYLNRSTTSTSNLDHYQWHPMEITTHDPALASRYPGQLTQNWEIGRLSEFLKIVWNFNWWHSSTWLGHFFLGLLILGGWLEMLTFCEQNPPR